MPFVTDPQRNSRMLSTVVIAAVFSTVLLLTSCSSLPALTPTERKILNPASAQDISKLEHALAEAVHALAAFQRSAFAESPSRAKSMRLAALQTFDRSLVKFREAPSLTLKKPKVEELVQVLTLLRGTMRQIAANPDAITSQDQFDLLLQELHELLRTRSVIGVYISSAANGVRIDKVVPGSPAEHTGLRAGDIILQIHQTPVKTPKQMIQTVSGIPPGTPVRLKLQRDHRLLEITIRPTLASIFE
ncbi:MAG: PDZ domain-containing protein [Lentisphaerae bacterium]|nr:MAG: PDZ domain-containing protein [Lentisphaerota bacterium]